MFSPYFLKAYVAMRRKSPGRGHNLLAEVAGHCFVGFCYSSAMLLHDAGQATVAFERVFLFPLSRIHELISGYLI